jgi:stage IV sporulation protein FB
MNWAISLGSIAGIRVRVHFTFVLFLLWIGAAFWQAGGPDRAATGIAYILLLFACVVAHEFGHILVAARYGGVTEDVILLPIGGVARMRHIPEAPREELAVALAGPAVNVVIATVLIALIGPHALASGLGVPGRGIGILPGLAVANLVLAVFNLLPAFPMDGGRALRALLSIRMGRAGATDLATRIGHALAVGMGVSGLLFGYPMLMLVALFIWFGASAENSEAQLHGFARRLSVADAMITRYATLPAGATIAEAVSLLIHSTQHDIPILDGAGKPVGLLTRDRILAALHQHGGGCPVADVLRADIPRVSDSGQLDDALRLMEEQGLPAVLAVDRAGRLTGLVTLENLGQMLLLNRLGR